MERFVARVELRTPVLLGGFLTLDALLAAVLFEQTRDIDRAHGEIPLANTDGMWHLFTDRTSQCTTGASTQGGATHTARCGARCTPRGATNDSARLSFSLGGDSRSCRAAHGTTDDLAGPSPNTLADRGSGSSTECAADRRLGGAVGTNRVR